MANFIQRLLSYFRHTENQEVIDDGSLCIEYTVTGGGSRPITVSHRYKPDLTLFINHDNQPEKDDDLSHITHLISAAAPVEPTLRQLTLFISMTHLIVVKCDLKELPSSVAMLFQLQVLDVTDNRLIELPESISSLRNLQKIYIMHNKLKHLPKALTKLPLLEVIEVFGNPLKWPPMQVALRGVAEIKSFMHEELSAQNSRLDVLRNSKPYGSSIFKSSFTVPSLQELVTSFILENNVEYEYLPTRLNHRLTVVEDFTRFHVTISKCSQCEKYFSSPTSYQIHVCFNSTKVK